MVRFIAVGSLIGAFSAGCIPPPEQPGVQAAYSPSPEQQDEPAYEAVPTPEADEVTLPAVPQLVRVTLVSALIGPGKIDGTMWDGPGHEVEQETVDGLAAALAGSNPYAAAAGIMAGLAQSSLDKPDPTGFAELYSAGETWRAELPMAFRDTFTPSWDATFDEVDLEQRPRIRITLRDRDVMNDDAIGTVELGANDMLAALKAGNVYQVRVAEQAQNQLLFVGISVIAR